MIQIQNKMHLNPLSFSDKLVNWQIFVKNTYSIFRKRGRGDSLGRDSISIFEESATLIAGDATTIADGDANAVVCLWRLSTQAEVA